MTMWVYGDSFAAPGPGCWPSQTAALLKQQLINQALGGSSTEYSFRLFARALQQRSFQPGDIIVFVTSTPGRLFFQHHQQHAPQEAGMYFHPDCEYPWYQRNRKQVQWYLENVDWSVLSLNHEAYISTMRDAARQHPDCLFVTLPVTTSTELLGLCVDPPNFVRSHVSLMDISSREVRGYSLPQFYDLHPDPRTCHLCVPNLRTLTQCMVRVIQDRCAAHISADLFETDLITGIRNRRQYMDLVRRDVLCWKDWFAERLRD